jgi:hypothetical protein
MNDQHLSLPFAHVTAPVSRAQAARLVGYDHHRVRVGARLGVLLTYHWLPLDDTPEPLALMVVFPPLPVALAHPAAPEQIQALINQLVFT